jgi:hypothetical protein
MTTTNATHTPGPWELTQYGAVVRKDGHGQTVVYTDNGESCINGEANARLIAAAPDLLAALEMVMDAAEDGGDMNDIDWDMIRAAIARAEGGAA